MIYFDTTNLHVGVLLEDIDDSNPIIGISWQSLDGMPEKEYIPEIGRLVWEQVSDLSDHTIMKLTLSLRKYQEEQKLVYDSGFDCRETISFMKKEYGVETVEELMSKINKINRNHSPEDILFPNSSLSNCFEEIIVFAAVYCSRTLSDLFVRHYTRILPRLAQKRAYERVNAAKLSVANTILNTARERAQKVLEYANKTTPETIDEVGLRLIEHESERTGNPVVLVTTDTGKVEFLDC